MNKESVCCDLDLIKEECESAIDRITLEGNYEERGTENQKEELERLRILSHNLRIITSIISLKIS